MKASMSLEDLKAQNVILQTRTVRENRGSKEGMVLELALSGSTLECLRAASNIMAAVAVQVAIKDGKLNSFTLADSVMMAEHYYKKALLDQVEKANATGPEGDEHARLQ